LRYYFLIFLLSSSLASAQGFVPTAHSSLPEAVQQAAQSVVRVLAKADTDLPIVTYNLAETAEFVTRACSSGAISFLEYKNCLALQACIEYGGVPGEDIPYVKATGFPEGETYCFRPYNDGGTAFVIENDAGRVKLLTNYHVVNEPNAATVAFLGGAIKNYPAERRVELTQKLKVGFDIFDQEGQLLSSVNSSQMQFSQMGDILGPDTAATAGERAVGDLHEDFAVLQFDSALLDLPAIGASDRSPQQDEPIYAVGFPVQSYARVHNSDGWQQYTSTGKAISREDFFARIQSAIAGHQANDEPLNAKPNYQVPQRGLLYSDADVISGMSGGPLLNAKGEVLALIVKSFATPESDSASAVIALYFNHLPL
jgi:S1-C subfamily serine protease